MRLLQRMRKQFVLAADIDVEILALVGDLTLREKFLDDRQCFFLNVPALIEGDAHAFELIRAIARSKAQQEAAVAKEVEEGGVFGDTNRIGHRQRNHAGADLDVLQDAGVRTRKGLTSSPKCDSR